VKRMIFLIVSIIVLCCSVAEAQNTPVKKLLRGVVNIVTAPIEVPKQARAYWIKGAQLTPHILVWIFSGSVWGVVEGIKREGSGVWDIVSFPLNKPEGFDPLFKPDFVFDKWPKNPKSGR